MTTDPQQLYRIILTAATNLQFLYPNADVLTVGTDKVVINGIEVTLDTSRALWVIDYNGTEITGKIAVEAVTLYDEVVDDSFDERGFQE